jgi:hypothetical protein
VEREKYWLDDLASVITSTYDFLNTQRRAAGLNDVDAASKTTVIENIVCKALEFAWGPSGSVTFRGKEHRAWSSLRAELKELMITMHVAGHEAQGVVNIGDRLAAALSEVPPTTSSAGDHQSNRLDALTALLEVDPAVVESMSKFVIETVSSPLPTKFTPGYRALFQAVYPSILALECKADTDLVRGAAAAIGSHIFAVIPTTWWNIGTTYMEISGEPGGVQTSITEKLFAGDVVMAKKFMQIRTVFVITILCELAEAGLFKVYNDPLFPKWVDLLNTALSLSVATFASLDEGIQTESQWVTVWSDLLISLRAAVARLTTSAIKTNAVTIVNSSITDALAKHFPHATQTRTTSTSAAASTTEAETESKSQAQLATSSLLQMHFYHEALGTVGDHFAPLDGVPIFSIPANTLSTFFVKAFSDFVGALLYSFAFSADAVKAFRKVCVKVDAPEKAEKGYLSTKGASVKLIAGVLDPDIKFYFCGPVSTTRTVTSLPIVQVACGDIHVPLYIQGDKLARPGAECAIPAWMVTPVGAGDDPTMVLAATQCSFKTFPPHISNPVNKDLEPMSLDGSVLTISVYALTPHVDHVGKLDVTLTRALTEAEGKPKKEKGAGKGTAKFNDLLVSYLGAVPFVEQLMLKGEGGGSASATVGESAAKRKAIKPTVWNKHLLK